MTRTEFIDKFNENYKAGKTGFNVLQVMTEEQFIEKWLVGYEDNEQKAEEMMADLDRVVSLHIYRCR